MGWIFVDKDSEGGGNMRQQMRRNMSGGYRMGESGDYRTEYDRGYRHGYRHGWEDSEDEEGYRRQRDSRGRFM